MDTGAVDSQNQRNKMTYLLLVVSVLMLAVKTTAYFWSNSQAILSDALENIVNVITASLVFLAIRYAQKPADKDHPYGHGKVEFFSSAFEGALILLAGIFILGDSISLWIYGYELKELNLSLWLIGLTSVVNGGLGYYLVKNKASHRSLALESSGKHLLSDAYTTIAVILGLLVFKVTQIKGIDIALAVLVAINLMVTGFRIVRQSFSGLMDEQDVDLIKTLGKGFSKHRFEGLIQIHHLKVIRSGWNNHIDAHVVLPQFWDVSTVHDKIHMFEHKVIGDLPSEGEMNFHFDPCRQVYCKHCDLKDCPIRLQTYENFLDFDLRHLQSPNEPQIF